MMADPYFKPLVLITNDDGLFAPGLQVLAAHLDAVAEVWVAAPADEQSAVGHGISLNRPLRVKQHGERRFAVSGSPADAVILALHFLCPRRPDLVISGINHGFNLGTDVFYSGTVAGALEGAIRGVQGMSVSQDLPLRELQARSPTDPEVASLFERTAEFAAELASKLLQHPLPPSTILNVNAPALETRRYAWTRLGKRIYREQVERRLDLRQVPYYWIGGPPQDGINEAGTDSFAAENGLISITALGLDLSVRLPEGTEAWEVSAFSRQA